MFRNILRNIFPGRAGTAPRIYLDYASATPVLPGAQAAVEEAYEHFGNPGGLHAEAEAARASLNTSRATLAHALGVRAKHIVFTSGGTEANNLAILGHFKHVVLSGVPPQETHWVTSALEHPSVLACFTHIEEMGGQVTYLEPQADGRHTVADVEHALTAQTKLVSIGWANSEIGVIQPIRALARAVHAYKEDIRFHTDAGQAPLYTAPHIQGLEVDMMTLDAGKLYGPRGIGALFVADDNTLQPMILGGSQERGVRAGTENVALAAGFAYALAHVQSEREEEGRRLAVLRDQLQEALVSMGAVVNGSTAHRLPHILNVSLPDFDSEYAVLALDHHGIAAATKSACREGETDVSHVVVALGGEKWRAQGTIRFSLGRETHTADIERAIRACTAVLHASQ